ncbi:hypothetical protein T03_7076 [Trichinella britovi]|uniref:Uncharacterized protein n=1 Tax=Trichinella britovi TaxID=45882 RepID=A0A0V1AMM8_TRIBR|nr:hypothetical protein T03_7076 [Trichinella britovi]
MDGPEDYGYEREDAVYGKSAVVGCRFAFRPKFAPLTPAVIYKRDSSNEIGYE